VKITVLGSGTSQGVPVIACICEVCKSTDSKDKRLRCSILIEMNGRTIVIDTGPDFRQQMLRENVQSLDAILFTHEHKDHIAGLDDVRAFNFKQGKEMQIYCDRNVKKALEREFYYVFSEVKYPGIPKLDLNVIDKNEFNLFNSIDIQPIEVMHYKLPVLGYRIGDFTYITDAKTISEDEKKKIKGTKILIVNALHRSQHISHFNLQEALAFIEEIKPEKAYLTHISHLFGKHEEILKELPTHISVCYDGLKITL
jgi:phosphoribosyl 1,2-cyclic phosphate phosphodiesterase